MEGLKRLLIIFIVLLLLAGVTSCEKLLNSGNGDSILITDVKYIGYEYVILEVTAENFESIYNDAEFYVGDELIVNVNNAFGQFRWALNRLNYD